MNTRLFSEAISELDDKYYMEAFTYQPNRTRRIGVNDPSLNGMDDSPTPERQKRHGLRLVTRIAVAAALIFALSVTAYAVYRATIKDYFLPSPVSTAEPAQELTPEPTSTRLSMVGYQQTPEYTAYAEWTAWNDEHPYPQYLAPDGSDHNEDYVWPDYHPYYGAFYDEQGEALDEILETYGLTPHTSRDDFSDIEHLYDVLEITPILPEDIHGSGYIYEDGTFKLELDGLVSLYDTIFVNTKGSFAQIEGSIDMTQGYEEWEYTTASGETVDLVLAAEKSVMLMETNGAYITVFLGTGSEAPVFAGEDEEEKAYLFSLMDKYFPDIPEEEIQARWDESMEVRYRAFLESAPDPITREELEAIADMIDFSVLAERFGGSTP